MVKWVGVLLEVPQIIITKAYDVCKIYGCIFNFFWGVGLGGWGVMGSTPNSYYCGLRMFPCIILMFYITLISQFILPFGDTMVHCAALHKLQALISPRRLGLES